MATSFFKDAVSQYTPTDNSAELRKESSASRLVPEIHGLYAIDAIHPGLKESDPDAFKKIVETKCPFFYNNYGGVLDCWIKHPKEKRVFLGMVQALRKIELGVLTQHEASQEVGAALQSFIPSELNVDADRPDCVQPATNITWAEWKKQNILSQTQSTKINKKTPKNYPGHFVSHGVVCPNCKEMDCCVTIKIGLPNRTRKYECLNCNSRFTLNKGQDVL